MMVFLEIVQVVRGGSWFNGTSFFNAPDRLRAVVRSWLDLDEPKSNAGFRLVVRVKGE